MKSIYLGVIRGLYKKTVENRGKKQEAEALHHTAMKWRVSPISPLA
jgi:hypothetical protein